jgi:NTE family protein
MYATSARLLGCGLVALAAGCATGIQNAPRNVPLQGISNTMQRQWVNADDLVDEVAVALSFSGGGLRAAAFSFGVLQGLDELPGHAGKTLLDDVIFISSVSGGSMTAAYYGLHGKKALGTFREKGLLRDGEADLRTSLWNPVNLARLAAGGLNDRDNFQRWLDEDLFERATFADLLRRGRPDVWINATDVYHRVAFPFSAGVFDAICSDLGSFPVSEAVAASMAVPLVFAPVVLETFPGACASRMPPHFAGADSDPGASLLMRTIARAVRNVRSPEAGRYVKLIDGGVTDNFGLMSIMQSRLARGTLYAPLSEADAVRVKRLLYVVVDAGQGPNGNWSGTPEGPSGAELAAAAMDAALETNVRLSFDSFVPMMQQWRDDLVQHRCNLDTERLVRLRGSLAGWNCADVQFRVTRVSFDDLGAERARSLSAIPTRLVLPAEQVDALVDAGRDAVKRDAMVRAFAAGLARQ